MIDRTPNFIALMLQVGNFLISHLLLLASHASVGNLLGHPRVGSYGSHLLSSDESEDEDNDRWSTS
jgi:hypothetical protein